MKNYLEILKNFTGNDELRPVFNDLFKVDDSVFATDARIMIWTDYEKVKDIEVKDYENPSSILSIMPLKHNLSFKINLSLIKSILDKAPLVDEIKEEGDEKECDECNGFGEVEWEYQEHTRDMDCPVCDGEGVVGNIKEIKTGNKILNQNKAIKIGVSTFRIDLIKKIYDACNEIRSEYLELVFQDRTNHASKFVFKDFELILMPYSCGSEDVIGLINIEQE